jgi:hypothetical protein
VVVAGGDLVGMGSSPAEVLDRIRDLGWPAIQGNSDEALWNDTHVEAFFSTRPHLAAVHVMAKRANAWTRDAIGDARLAWVRGLPFAWSGEDLTVVHASPGDAWQSPMSDASDAALEETYRRLGTRIVVYGHTHGSFIRQLRSAGGPEGPPLRTMTVANCGSVSLSFDGDRRAAYALVDDDRVTIHRVEYDVEREIRALAERQCPDREWMTATLRAARPQSLVPADAS